MLAVWKGRKKIVVVLVEEAGGIASNQSIIRTSERRETRAHAQPGAIPPSLIPPSRRSTLRFLSLSSRLLSTILLSGCVCVCVVAHKTQPTNSLSLLKCATRFLRVPNKFFIVSKVSTVE